MRAPRRRQPGRAGGDALGVGGATRQVGDGGDVPFHCDTSPCFPGDPSRGPPCLSLPVLWRRCVSHVSETRSFCIIACLFHDARNIVFEKKVGGFTGSKCLQIAVRSWYATCQRHTGQCCCSSDQHLLGPGRRLVRDRVRAALPQGFEDRRYRAPALGPGAGTVPGAGERGAEPGGTGPVSGKHAIVLALEQLVEGLGRDRGAVGKPSLTGEPPSPVERSGHGAHRRPQRQPEGGNRCRPARDAPPGRKSSARPGRARL